MTQQTVSYHWRAVVSQPHQGPIHQAPLTEKEREDVSKKLLIYRAPWRPKTQRHLEDRELNQVRSKPDTVDRPVSTARTFVHHYNSTQYCNIETVFLQYSPSSRPTSHLRCGQVEVIGVSVSCFNSWVYMLKIEMSYYHLAVPRESSRFIVSLHSL